VDGHEVNFKLDTGVEVSVIPEETMKTKNPERRLMGADKSPLEVMCEFVARLHKQGDHSAHLCGQKVT
jgi:hypothetical protein